MSKVVELAIEGMTCEHCVKAVTNALRRVPGVRDVTVSLEGKSARVEGDVFATDALLGAVRDEGYEAQLKG